ncbi:RNA degradosome polyphosphate kinase [Bacillus canaveralius]|uniref:Polyphosphate kinase n=1 Tax=Bacillus canaveralius TaxID=1403243 RepID=A0A2N5GLB3_9BACI|nr:RNA degradosome polyphosphate kinase [Bacillus canaveralius]PLR95602.1 RNA degradosome polyphosphate kinase [Bacillus canaveralius]
MASLTLSERNLKISPLEKGVINLQQKIDLNQPAFFNNRELSWLAFNNRVLEEAMDERNPLLERLRFLAIFSSNLDEFYMVRVAGLKDQIKVGYMKPENKAGLTPKEQITEITKFTHEMVCRQYLTFKQLLSLLAKENISFLSIKELEHDSLMYLEQHFDKVIFPVLTPMAIDAYRPFPLLANRSMNIAIVLSEKDELSTDIIKLAIVQVPRGFARFVEVPNKAENGIKQFVLIEDLISHFVHKLFHGLHVESVTQFRITRNADLEIHEEGARDLLEEIEEELKMRKWGATVRLEVAKDFFDPEILTYLLDELEIHEKDIYFINGPLDLTFLFSFYKQIAPVKEHLIFETYMPQPPQDLIQNTNGEQPHIFDIAASKDILMHHPYESFEPVIDLVRCAAEDPNVLAIKQTLYRVSASSPIIENLKKAAENGKQVLVLVELKARFDEEHNVHWAKELEKSGCHVIYGKTSLKTHSKITLIVRKMNETIQRFVHLATGNYNEETAKFYTDLGLITSNPEFGIDATNFFNYLSGFMEKPDFQHFYVSPMDIRKYLIRLVNQEIEYHQQFGNGRIILKMNSVTDKKIIVKLYEASRAGVKIDLIVRGICCLRPKIEGVSDNIRVISIVGRYLEHSRIYYFHHNGREKMILSSADLMTRNMEKRVEIAFPVINDELKARLKKMLTIQLSDNAKAREQDQYGNYSYVTRNADDQEIDSQMIFLGMAYQVTDDEE